MRVIVGERFNQRRWVTDWPRWELMLRLGSHNRGGGRAMLRRHGFTWDHGINLLLPSPVVGEWDADEARRVADYVRPFLRTYDVVYLLGARVALAFGLSGLDWFEWHDNYVLLPHPSGRNRVWNRKDVRECARSCSRMSRQEHSI